MRGVLVRLLVLLALLALLVMTASPKSLAAQEPARAAGPLRWEQVLESVQRHPKRIVAEAQLMEAQGAAMSARGAFDPTLKAFVGGRPVGYYDQFVAGASMSWDSPLWGARFEGGWRRGVGDFASYEGKRETLSGGELFAGVSVPLLYGGPLDGARAERLQTRAGLDGAEALRDEVALDLRVGAASAYWAWAAAGQAAQVAAELLELARAREAGLLRTIEEGAAAPIDGLEFQRSVLSRRSKLAEAEAKRDVAAAKLALYLRDEDGRPIVPAASAVPPIRAPEPQIRLAIEDALEQAWAQRPEGRRWRAAQESAEVGLRLARANMLPRLDLEVGASADLPRKDGSPDSLGEPTLDARVDLAWPTAMRASRGKLAQGRAKVEQVEAKARLARDELRAEIVSLAAKLSAAEARLGLADESVSVTGRLAAAERTRFGVGDSDLLFVNLREQTAAAARQERAWLQAEVYALRAAWEVLVNPSGQ